MDNIKEKMRKVYLLFLTICSVGLLYAQDAKTLFLSSPDSITPLLTEVNRADFIDFLESNMKAQVKNKFGAVSEMTALTSDYLSIQMSANSTWEMKLLPVSDSIQVVCVVHSVCAPVCDSSVTFYTTSWEKLNVSQYISLPSINDFLVSVDSSDSDELYVYNMLRSRADILFARISFSQELPGLLFFLTTPEYMVKEDAEEMAKYIRPVLTYQWGQRFELVSNQ